MAKPIINQLNGGEISPWLEGRVDLPKYGYSAKLMRNFIPLVEGSIVRRGGSHFVASCKELTAVKFAIEATPAEADVFINNEFTDDVNCAPGEIVTYTVSADGYQTVTGTYTVTEDITLKIELLSQQYRNTLTIIPSPADADVYINGVKTSSAVVIRGSTATYRVEKEGYDTIEEQVVVNTDRSISVTMSMSFEIVPTPADAIVKINGNTTKKKTVALGEKITWSVSAAGYTAQTGTFTVTESDILYINLKNIYNINEVIFEKSAPGTYTLSVKVAGWYNLATCSAGGGGGGSALKHSWKGSNGASGAAFIGKIKLEQTTYSIKIGKGGAGGAKSGRNATAGQPQVGNESYNAGYTYIKKTSNPANFNITMSPGKGGFGTGNYSSTPLAGGDFTYWVGVNVQSQTLKSAGKIQSTISLLGNGFGAGGKAIAASDGTAGTNGYLRLIYLGQV